MKKYIKWLIIAVKIIVAFVFIYSGILKLIHEQGYLNALVGFWKVFHSVSDWNTIVTVNIQPWFEIILGIVWLLPLNKIVVGITVAVYTVYIAGILIHYNIKVYCPYFHQTIGDISPFTTVPESLLFWLFLVSIFSIMSWYHLRKRRNMEVI
jgi:hypothetical protein